MANHISHWFPLRRNGVTLALFSPIVDAVIGSIFLLFGDSKVSSIRKCPRERDNPLANHSSNYKPTATKANLGCKMS